MEEQKKGIKNSYDLALERLGGSEGAGPALTEKQKNELAAIDRETEAKIAEQEILLKSRIVAALQSQQPDEAVKLRDQLMAELRRIRERGEAKKEEIRKAGHGDR